jgi:hypothetical protein
MKKSILALLGIGAACAACCAIPLALPLLAALGLAGFGISSATLGWGTGLLMALPMLAMGGLYLLRRRKVATTCAADRGCGCA